MSKKKFPLQDVIDIFKKVPKEEWEKVAPFEHNVTYEHPLYGEYHKLRSRVNDVIDILYDYDGHCSTQGLKKLIDETRQILIDSLRN